ncbi:cytolethal distending toxin subunit B [Collimonas sp. PA-H2]|uniref:cytolethal distending toxin subunit B family protein n=1 Tax=Collimonas sp. PA-H2 TaxID=1881062 RepID=UPI000C004113|nr:cytolethal distending toxin subunit B family protein [Collimonas sp. PA-H2]PFH07828.1 cytolethal distending toxin subunit B [Collimonas sp. PA-H2]
MRTKILPALIIFLIIYLPNTAFAGLEDYRTATWNLQGASAATESKWNVNIRQMVSGDGEVDVLAIQEAGAVPSTAVLTNRVIPSPPGTTIPIREYEWNLGTRGRPNIRYIYFAENDLGAHRVNTAVVTRRRADNIVALANPSQPQGGRPLLGIGFNRTPVGGRDYFFTLHAFATGGGDAAPSINAIHNHFTQQDPRDQWLVMGDYNVDPDILTTRINRYPLVVPDITIVRQPSATHAGGHNLDYAVAGQNLSAGSLATLLAAVMFVAQLHGQLASDHTPVRFSKR